MLTITPEPGDYYNVPNVEPKDLVIAVIVTALVMLVRATLILVVVVIGVRNLTQRLFCVPQTVYGYTDDIQALHNHRIQ